jgi:hypothetical protein
MDAAVRGAGLPPLLLALALALSALAAFAACLLRRQQLASAAAAAQAAREAEAAAAAASIAAEAKAKAAAELQREEEGARPAIARRFRRDNPRSPARSAPAGAQRCAAALIDEGFGGGPQNYGRWSCGAALPADGGRCPHCHVFQFGEYYYGPSGGPCGELAAPGDDRCVAHREMKKKKREAGAALDALKAQ